MSFARSIADLFSKATSGATDAEVTAAISTHNTSANGHVNRGTSANRPVGAIIGDLYYNTEIKDLEEYTEDGWLIVAKQVPRIPEIGDATLGNNNDVSVSFTPSQYGQPASSYTVQSNPGSYTATGSSSPITVSGTNLEVGTPYTFRVRSSGTYGQSSYSSYSSSITPVLITSYESIESVTVGSGGQAIVNFTNIPSTYAHLQVRMLVRQTSTSNGYTARFNSDSGSNYTRHLLIGSGSSVSAAGDANRTHISLNDSAISTSNTNVFGVSVCDILDYSNTNKNTTVRTLGGFDNNVNGSVFFNSGVWMNTAAITSITITPDAGNFAQYSQFALYGIKGA